MLDGLFTAIGDMISSGINSGSNYAIQQATNEMNYKIAQEANQNNIDLQNLAYQQNLEQWNRENEYNSPIAQMARYAEAGLNKNLIYGQQNTSASSPKLSYLPQNVAHMEAPKINLQLEGLFKLLNLKNALKNQNLDIEKKTQDVELAKYSNLMAAESLKAAINDNLYRDRLNLGKLNQLENSNSLFPYRQNELSKKLEIMQKDLELKDALNSQQTYKLKILKHQSDFWDRYGMDPSNAPFYFKFADAIFGTQIRNIIKKLDGFKLDLPPYPSTHQ